MTRPKSISNRFSLVFLFFYFLTYSCKSPTPGQAIPEVEVVNILNDDVLIKEEFVGQTYGYKDIAIRARVDGVVEGMHFEEGKMVKKGQLLYTIDSQPFQAKAATAQGQLSEAKTRMIQAKNDLDRYIPLAEIQAVSRKDLDAAQANYNAAVASYEAAQAYLRSINIELGYTEIKAPISGFIGKSEAKEGDYVGKAPNPVVLNVISEVDPILVRFSLSESEYLKVIRYVRSKKSDTKTKQEPVKELELVLADETVHDHLGHFDFIDSHVDPQTGTIQLQASFDNPDKIVRAGQFAKVRMAVENIKDAKLIPQRCVQELQGKYFVYSVGDSSLVKRLPVELGEKLEDMVIVNSGLEGNEKIIITGLQKIKSGAQVAAVDSDFKPVFKNE